MLSGLIIDKWAHDLCHCIPCCTRHCLLCYHKGTTSVQNNQVEVQQKAWNAWLILLHNTWQCVKAFGPVQISADWDMKYTAAVKHTGADLMLLDDWAVWRTLSQVCWKELTMIQGWKPIPQDTPKILTGLEAITQNHQQDYQKHLCTQLRGPKHMWPPVKLATQTLHPKNTHMDDMVLRQSDVCPDQHKTEQNALHNCSFTIMVIMAWSQTAHQCLTVAHTTKQWN